MRGARIAASVALVAASSAAARGSSRRRSAPDRCSIPRPRVPPSRSRSRCDPCRARRTTFHAWASTSSSSHMGASSIVPAGIGIAPPLRRRAHTSSRAAAPIPLRTREPTGVIEVCAAGDTPSATSSPSGGRRSAEPPRRLPHGFAAPRPRLRRRTALPRIAGVDPAPAARRDRARARARSSRRTRLPLPEGAVTARARPSRLRGRRAARRRLSSRRAAVHRPPGSPRRRSRRPGRTSSPASSRAAPAPSSGSPTTVAFTIRQPSGKPLSDFQRGPGPHTGVHLIIVRDDLAYDHPPPSADRVATAGSARRVTFPVPGPLPRRRRRLPEVRARSPTSSSSGTSRRGARTDRSRCRRSARP